MRYSTSGMILAAMSIGEAMAGPTHAHLHQRAHEKKNVDYNNMDWNNMGIDWKSAYAAGQASKTAAASAAASPAVLAAVKPSNPPAAAPVAPAPKSSPTASSSSSGSTTNNNNALGSLLEGVFGAANKISSFGSVVAGSGGKGDSYMGNCGNPYGHNVMLVDSVGNHPYTNTFKNTQSKTILVNIWNKIGPDGRSQSGASMAPTNTTLIFSLAPGASQVVAFQENSQVAWAEPVSGRTPAAAYETTWGEANFDTGNGFSFDVSAINNPNKNYNMVITSKEKDCTSSPGENSWTDDKTYSGTSYGNCFTYGNTATLQTIMGGTM